MTEDNKKEFFKTRTIIIEIVSEKEIRVSQGSGAINSTPSVYRDGVKGYSINVPEFCEADPGPSHLTFEELKELGDGSHEFRYKEKLLPGENKSDPNRPTGY